MDDMCDECGALCCQYFCFEIDEPDCFEEFDDIRWYLLHEGITVHIDEGDWYISIENKCKALDLDNRCTVYEDRPIICRRYSADDCDYTHGDYGYDELFETPEDIERYARRVLGDEEYETERAKTIAKLEGKTRKKPKKKCRTGRRKR